MRLQITSVEFQISSNMFFVIHLFVLSLAIISTQCGESVHNPFYCYSQDPIRPQNARYGIRTAYEAVRGQNINANVSTCNPSKFWMMSRHGTSLPNPNDLNNMLAIDSVYNEILSNYNQGRTSLCSSDIELLRNWEFNPNITAEFAHYLAASGWDEFEGIAQRYRAAFPSILSSTYSPNDYLFRGTNFQRSQASLHAFADGLFGVDGHKNVNFVAVEPDYLLRGYTLCPLYADIMFNLPERDAFREGPEFQQMMSQVSAKIGFHGSHALRNNDVNTLSILCAFEQNWNLNEASPDSPFCSAFSVANRQVLEYLEDLEFYYRVGPGNVEHRRLFENMVCFNMQELIQFLVSNDPTDHKARIYSNLVTVLPMMLNNLGAFGTDERLTQHNFAQQIDRVWRTGSIIPMGANLVVVRYE